MKRYDPLYLLHSTSKKVRKRKLRRYRKLNQAQTAYRRLLRAQAIERQGGRCFYCEREFSLSNRQRRATLEHLKEQSHGGQDTPENTVAACANCNHKRPKSTMLEKHAPRTGTKGHHVDAARVLADEEWYQEIEHKIEQANLEEYAADLALEQEEVSAIVRSLRERGEHVDTDIVQGGEFRVRDSLGHLKTLGLITGPLERAARLYQRLWLEAHSILQPWLPPPDMMEWRLERAILLRDIRVGALGDDGRFVGVLDDVCGRNKWIIGRGNDDWLRVALMMRAAELAADWLGNGQTSEKKVA